MSQVIVVVTFYSRDGATEKLTTAAAVGAVQARAGIRMRRVPDVDPEAAFERFPQFRDSLRRMHKEYVAPREADVLAADALIFGSSADVDAASPEWASYVKVLEKLRADGKLVGKVGAAVGNGPSSESFSALIQRLGLVTVSGGGPSATEGDDVARAVALGRQVVAAAQGQKVHRT